MKRSGKAVVGVLAALATVLALAVPGHAAFPGKNGKIAYFSGAEQDIFTVDPDGANSTRLSDQPAFRVFPSWSADGARIAFSGTNQFGIAVMNADGTGETQLTSTPWFDLNPAWAPDGTMVAFDHTEQCDLQRCTTNVHVVNSDGTGIRALCCGRGYRAMDPSWSPDGTEIAFTRAPDPAREPRELWRMRPDGSGAVRVCCDGRNISTPDWAPDGSRISLTTISSLMTVHPDGSGLHTVYTPPANARILNAAWSPDGNKIVVSQDDGAGTTATLHVVNADGSGVAPVPNLQDAYFPSWQPIPGPRRDEYGNAAAFCQAEHDFWGESAFGVRYGENRNGANAFGKCVSQAH